MISCGVMSVCVVLGVVVCVHSVGVVDVVGPGVVGVGVVDVVGIV